MTEKIATKLNYELIRKFGGSAEFEEKNPGQFRFSLISPQFAGVPHLQRQDQVWEVIEKVLTPDEILDLTLVLTYTPEEIQLVPNI